MAKTLPPPPTTTRAPGQHLDETIREEFEWKYFYTAGVASGLFVAALMVWFYWLTGNGTLPWAMTLAAVAGIIVMVVWTARIRPRLHAWKYGLRGEREVGAVLGDLGRLGYIVRHDIQCEKDGRRWNIDHLVIGPSDKCLTR